MTTRPLLLVLHYDVPDDDPNAVAKVCEALRDRGVFVPVGEARMHTLHLAINEKVDAVLAALDRPQP